MRGPRQSSISDFASVELPKDNSAINVLDGLRFTDEDEEAGADNVDDNKKTFTMVFAILKLEGPLFSVGFVDISGLTAGVGVNSAIRLPTAETVLDFPFTKPSGTPGPSEGPLAALSAVLFPPKDVVP